VLRIYVAASLSQAHLVQQMLLAAGIPSRVLNEHSGGALGELASTSVWPEVWIDRDQQADLASQLITELESRADEEQICATCGEINPSTFEICWRCDEQFPVTA
jgi:ribosomal protein L40E